MIRDDLFERQEEFGDFRFDQATATVFDDMVGRSVPFYHEIQRMTAELAADFAVEGTNLYDLGCSTGTTLLELDRKVASGVRFVGFDNSEEMLVKGREKLAASGLQRPYDLRQTDLHQGTGIENASVVIMLLTLQFIRPLYRGQLIRNIYHGLHDQGCLILVEKITLEDSMLNRLFIQHYYDMKRRNGYSDLEISRKRESLENVLIPYRSEENRTLLLSEGFHCCEEFFRWYNFAGLVAIK
jgi:tRNA (cmo5U34)-methyltransferase